MQVQEEGKSLSTDTSHTPTNRHRPHLDEEQTMAQNEANNGATKDTRCLACSSPDASVSVYTRLNNTEPLLFLLGLAVRRPVGDLAQNSDVVCDRCLQHFTLMHSLMMRLAKLVRKTSLSYNRATRYFARKKQQQQQQETGGEEECLLPVEDIEVEEGEKCIIGRALAMAATVTRSEDAAPRKFECPVCGKKFRAYSHRVEHMLVHTGERAFQCSECGFRASTKSNLKRHKERHGRECQCPVCGKAMASKASLKEHLRIHGTERPHVCSECGKGFLRRRDLHIHERGHEVNGPLGHECPQCRRRFVLRSRLARHMLVHCKDKQFTCNLCKKEFARKDDLKCHERIHTGEKPYSCPHCSRTFRYASNCRSHARVHRQPSLFCTPCGMTFTTEGKYSAHLRSKNHRGRCQVSAEGAGEVTQKEPVGEGTDSVLEVKYGVCGITCESLEQVSAHALTVHVPTPVLPSDSNTSIVVSGMGRDDENRTVSLEQLEGVSVVVEVDRSGAPLTLPLPHPSLPSTTLLNGDEETPHPSSALLPFSLEGKEMGGVAGTILASLTHTEEIGVCQGAGTRGGNNQS